MGPHPHPDPLPRSAGILLLAVTLAGCGESPAAPPGPILAPAAEVAALAPALDDAGERILPRLEDRAAAAAVGRRLEELSRALEERRGARAAQALAGAREALAAYGRGSAARVHDGADLSAVQLVLDAAARLLDG